MALNVHTRELSDCGASYNMITSDKELTLATLEPRTCHHSQEIVLPH